MIDICTVIYRNYSLLDLQVEHWKKLGIPNVDYRLICIDNTPDQERRITSYPVSYLSVYGTDGETHGLALDHAARMATTDIIGFVDSDFFWLDENILSNVQKMFDDGAKCVGCAGFYPDWQRVLDPIHPERAGHLAPVVWGMFVDRRLAMEQTFVSTAAEGAAIHETGWRLRKRIIDEQIPTVVFEGCYPDAWNDPDCCFFKHEGVIRGVHFLKGSSYRAHMTARIPEIIRQFSTPRGSVQ